MLQHKEEMSTGWEKIQNYEMPQFHLQVKIFEGNWVFLQEV